MATFTGDIDNNTLTGGAEDDLLEGLGGNDTLLGGAGKDTLLGGDGDDVLLLGVNDFVAGEVLSGGTGTDTLKLGYPSDPNNYYYNGLIVDLRDAVLDSIERLDGSEAGYNGLQLTMSAAQYAALEATTMALSSGSYNDKVTVMVEGTVDLSGPLATFSSLEAGVLQSDTGSVNLTISGAALDGLLRSGGYNYYGLQSLIDLHSGSILNLTSNSLFLEQAAGYQYSYGLVDAQLAGVSTISAAGSQTAVIVDMSTQSENLALIGSDQSDNLRGGQGGDTLIGGAGNDTLQGGIGLDSVTGGEGDDVLVIDTYDFVAGEVLSGGTGRDTLQLGYYSYYGGGGPVIVDLRDAVLDSIERIDAMISNGYSAQLTMSAAQYAALEASSMTMSSGSSDKVTVMVEGTVDLSGPLASFSQLETGVLLSEAGSVNLTISGAALDGLLRSDGGYYYSYGDPSRIDLVSGSTIHLTSHSVFLQLGSGNNYYGYGSSPAIGDDSLIGVSTITAAESQGGVTLDMSNQYENLTLIGSDQGDNLSGGQGSDTLHGGAGNDTLRGGAGADSVSGGDGDDLLYTYSNDAVAGDVISGGAGTDTLMLAAPSGYYSYGAVIVDLRGVVLDSIERIGATGTNGYGTQLTMTAAQYASLEAATMNMSHDGPDKVTVMVEGIVDLSGARATFSSLETGVLQSDAGSVNLTISGAALDGLMRGVGGGYGYGYGYGETSRIDLLYGSTLNLTSQSEFLIYGKNSGYYGLESALSDASLIGVSTISAAGSQGAITLEMSSQMEDLTLIGSNYGDYLRGGNGNDTLNGGAGDDVLIGSAGLDVLTGGEGDDVLVIHNSDVVAGELLSGGAGTDTLSLSDPFGYYSYSAMSVDLRSATLESIERIDGSNAGYYGLQLTMSASQFASLEATTMSMSSSAYDKVTIMVEGTVDLSGPRADFFQLETGILQCDAGSVNLTISGATLDGLLQSGGYNEYANTGYGEQSRINLFSGSTLNLTSNSVFLQYTSTDPYYGNGLRDASLMGVSTLSAAGSLAAVTLNMSTQTESLSLVGSAHNDTLTGGSGNDTLTGGQGDDMLNGGNGDDVAVYSGYWTQYTITGDANSATVSGIEGTDTLTSIEFLRINGVTYTIAEAIALNHAPGGVHDTNSGDAVIEAGGGSAGDDTAIGNVLANDTDADLGLPGEVLTVGAIDGGTVGNAVTGVYGSLVLNADGSYTYTLDNNDADTEALSTGQSVTETFSYTVTDTHGATGTASLTILIQGKTDNQAPVSSDGGTSGTEDGVISGTACASDADAGDTLTYSIVGSAPDGVILNSDGSYTVTPLAADQTMDDGESRVVTFQFKANDGKVDSNVSTITVTIEGANDAPVADAVSVSGDEDAASVSGSVSATDVDGEALTYSLVGGPIPGVTLNSDGSYSVDTIAADQAMDDGDSRVVTFQYIANDGTADSAAQTVTVTIHGVNDAPELTAPSALGYTDTVYDDSFAATGGTLSASDADGETLSFGIDGGTVTGNSVSFTGSYGTLVLDSITGEYTYTPDDLAIESLGGAATDSFTLTVSDGTASASQALTVNLTQSGVTETQSADSLSGVIGVAETFAGLNGNDTYTIDALDSVSEGAGGGTDTIVADFNHTLGANLENLLLTGRAISGTGNGLDNELTGNSGSNVLAGGAGNDRLDGGLGADTLSGGTGDDTYVLDSSGDRVTELAGEGTDLVLSSVGYALTANVENLTLTGSNTLSGSGNALANVITGNAGTNLLSGGDGNDTLYGLGGSDTLKGDAGNDVIAGGTGNDNVQGGAGDDSYLIARGEGTDTLTDTSGNDVLWFNDATISSEQLWFRQVSSDLEVSVIGTTTKVVVKGWYTAPANQVETIRAGDGMELLASEVQTLVSAMAAFSSRPAGGLTLTGMEQAALTPVLAANWS